MTVIDRERVIRLLQEMAEYFRECRNKVSFASKEENHLWELQNAANGAVELLKEQEAEPQTVLIRDDGEYCPHCSTITTRAMGLQKLHLGTRFCPYCGKAVKWE